MKFGFCYKGGILQGLSDQQRVEKFFLFFIIGGKEIPFYEMKKNALIESVYTNPMDEESLGTPTGFQSTSTWFSTNADYGKIFVTQSGYGIEKKFVSFYFRFVKKRPAPIVTVRPFSSDGNDMFFQGHISFLKKSEVRQLLPADSLSLKYLEQQIMLPIPILKKMITIDKSVLRKGLRRIRMKK